MNNIQISIKQFGKIPLFWNVKLINGEKMYKLLYESCRILECKLKICSDDKVLDKKFIYVKEGQILIYKTNNHSTKYKSLIKSYRANQFCGFQDYPLFWSESTSIQILPKTVLITIPVSLFHKFFRRVIPMTYLQTKAQYLKRLNLFKGIQLQKIFKIACLSHKYRLEQGKNIAVQGDEIKYIIIICSGKVQLSSTLLNNSIICGQNQYLFTQEINQGINECIFDIKCIEEGDILAIPQEEYMRIVDIRYNLKHQTIRRQKELKQQELAKIEKEKDILEQADQPKYSKTMYTKCYYNRSKTVGSEEIETRSFTKTAHSRISKALRTHNQTEYNEIVQRDSPNRPSTRCQRQLQQYLKRKETIKSRNFFRYVQSRAPDIILNPSKQFVIVKPFYTSNSLYMKNIKRKLKKSSMYSRQSQLSRQQFSQPVNFQL